MITSCGQQMVDVIPSSLSSLHTIPHGQPQALRLSQRCTTNVTQALPNRPQSVRLTNKQTMSGVQSNTILNTLHHR